MVTSNDGCETTLGRSLQRDVGCNILDGHDDSTRGVGAWFFGVHHLCGAEADIREGEEGESSFVLKGGDVDNSVLLKSRSKADGIDVMEERSVETGKSGDLEKGLRESHVPVDLAPYYW